MLRLSDLISRLHPFQGKDIPFEFFRFLRHTFDSHVCRCYLFIDGLPISFRDTLKIKLTPAVCYVAGLQCNSHEEHSAVGVHTSNKEIEQKFIEISVNELDIPPNRIIIREAGARMRHIYFYHSRICRRLKDVVNSSEKIFKRKNLFTASYIAGMFDATGHTDDRGLYLKRIGPREAILLQNLDIYTRGGRLTNPKAFLLLVRGSSILADQFSMKKPKGQTKGSNEEGHETSAEEDNN